MHASSLRSWQARTGGLPQVWGKTGPVLEMNCFKKKGGGEVLSKFLIHAALEWSLSI